MTSFLARLSGSTFLARLSGSTFLARLSGSTFLARLSGSTTTLLALVLLVLPACGATTPTATPSATVRFVIEPDTARVYTDGHFVGGARVLAARPESFRAGPRQFTITADGYFPHDLEVDLAAGETTIEISLRPVPP